MATPDNTKGLKSGGASRMTPPDMTKVLMSKQEIMDHLKISDKLYKKFIRMGMPVLYVDGRCYAHKDNLDEFFKAITRVSMKNAPDELIDGGENENGTP